MKEVTVDDAPLIAIALTGFALAGIVTGSLEASFLGEFLERLLEGVASGELDVLEWVRTWFGDVF